MDLGTLSAEQIAKAVGCSKALAEKFTPFLNEAFREYGITTFERQCAFLAQVGHESGSFRYTEEIWGPTPAQLTYEGRPNLGNNKQGDGLRFKGHGLIQITGRFNHAKVRDNLRKRFADVPDFEAQPTELCSLRWATLSAAEYWYDHGGNHLADKGEFERLTKVINGGLNGLPDRIARLERAKRALRQSEPIADPEPVAVIEKEPAMIPALLVGLASSLIENFVVPLAREKTTTFLNKHVDKPEMVDNVVTAIIDTAVAATGLSDPIAAVVAAKADPAIMEKIQVSALDNIDKLAPIVERMAALDREQFAAEEASRDSASARAKLDGNDQDIFLTRSIVGLMLGLMLAVALLIGILAYFKIDSTIVAGLAALFTTLAGGIASKFSTRYDHRYGSSRSSMTKDVVISELSKR